MSVDMEPGVLYCSPAEPKNLIMLTGAEKHGDCEQFWGADWMSITPFGFLLLQRKRFPSDWVASKGSDPRLNKEIKQFEGGKWKYLIIEVDPCYNGKIPWSTEGFLVGKYQGMGGVNRYELEATIESLAHFHKIHTRWTHGETDTAQTVLRLFKWCSKEEHTGIVPKRNSPSREELIRMKSDWRAWILTGFPGIGPLSAKKILEACPEPLQWNPSLDIESIPGIGLLKAKQMRGALLARER